MVKTNLGWQTRKLRRPPDKAVTDSPARQRQKSFCSLICSGGRERLLRRGGRALLIAATQQHRQLISSPTDGRRSCLVGNTRRHDGGTVTERSRAMLWSTCARGSWIAPTRWPESCRRSRDPRRGPRRAPAQGPRHLGGHGPLPGPWPSRAEVEVPQGLSISRATICRAAASPRKYPRSTESQGLTLDLVDEQVDHYRPTGVMPTTTTAARNRSNSSSPRPLRRLSPPELQAEAPEQGDEAEHSGAS